MPTYCVNRDPEPSGERAVHEEGCRWWPLFRVNLGWHPDCRSALRDARGYYPAVEACPVCCGEPTTPSGEV